MRGVINETIRRSSSYRQCPKHESYAWPLHVGLWLIPWCTVESYPGSSTWFIPHPEADKDLHLLCFLCLPSAVAVQQGCHSATFRIFTRTKKGTKTLLVTGGHVQDGGGGWQGAEGNGATRPHWRATASPPHQHRQKMQPKSPRKCITQLLGHLTLALSLPKGFCNHVYLIWCCAYYKVLCMRPRELTTSASSKHAACDAGWIITDIINEGVPTKLFTPDKELPPDFLAKQPKY